jgi:very-short-patch-repair endonuclease
MSELVARVRRIRGLERPLEQLLALLATEQHGVVAVWQLLELGFTRDAIGRRAKFGRLHRIYRGVYAVGHNRLTWRARCMAAVLACGPDAVLSHRAAVALWDLRRIPSGRIDVTAPGRTRHGHDGIHIHSVRSLHENDRTMIDGIPVTSIPRTLLDYAEVTHFQWFRLAYEEALRRELLDGRALDDLIARSRTRKGVKPLKRAMSQANGSGPWLQSNNERRFLTLVREAGLPEPRANVLVEGELVDFIWEEQKLVVEIDSYDFHKSRAEWRRDRERDAKLMRAGYRVLRIPEDRLYEAPRGVVADVLELLVP